jgi:hypothetical protein
MTVSARAALLAGLLVLPRLAAAAEDLPSYSVRPEEKSPAATEVLELDLDFPLSQLPQMGRAPADYPVDLRPSSRRTGTWRNWGPQAEPGLFSVDEDRPLKPLTGGWAEKTIWQPDYVDTWGTHPATPVPSRTPRLGLRLHDIEIVPVAGEEALDCPARCAATDGKCSKCAKCDACKCTNCSGKDCQGSGETLEHGETAKVILELMETLGRSVLDGTVFQKPGQADQEWLKELSADGQVSPREALIQYIRHLEAQEEQNRSRQVVQEEIEVDFVSHPLLVGKSPCSCPANDCECPSACHACPATCRDCPAMHAECRDCPEDGCACLASIHAPCLADDAESEVEVLREMSAHLEMAAHELERREIYQRADQLREVAGQLRQDARRSSLARAARKSHGIYAPKPPHHDVQAQLNELREELHRTRTELEKARGKRPPSR